MDPTLQQLGKRARARADEERAKRREIVVLEDYQPPQKVKKTTRKQPATPKQAPALHFPKSSVVQLEGLPSNCTPEMIRRFFSGLTPQRIAAFPASKYIWIVFDSAPIAAAALQRSGERMGDCEIDISLVVDHPKVMLRYLAMDAIPGESLRETRKRIESEVQSSVLSFLAWLVKQEGYTNDTFIQHEQEYPWDRPTAHKDLGELTTQYKDLCAQVDPIEKYEMLAADPEIVASDAVVRYHHLAYEGLKKEICRVQNLVRLHRLEQDY